MRGKQGPPAQVVEKRKQLKAMLTRRLQAQHGSDPVRKALIELEIERSPVLNKHNLSPEDLTTIERAVADAVRLAEKGNGAASAASAARLGRSLPRPDYSRPVEAVADWTTVAQYQAGFVNKAQQAQLQAKAAASEDLRQQLAHQRFERTQRKRAELDVKRRVRPPPPQKKGCPARRHTWTCERLEALPTGAPRQSEGGERSETGARAPSSQRQERPPT